MKRVVLAAAMLILLLGFNIFCLFTIERIKDETGGKLELLYESIDKENHKKNALECEKFEEYWRSEHHVLCLIVRHDLIDQITTSVSRFAPLAKHGENGELSAEIIHCKNLLEEIWDSERPFLRNIL